MLAKGSPTDEKVEKILLYTSSKDTRIKVHAEKDQVTLDGVPLPEGLKKKFLDLKRRKKSSSYLLKFWDKLQKNPSKNSKEMLYKFLEHNGHVITSTGNFTAYKAVKADMTDHHTGMNRHTIGRVMSMDRKSVVENPADTCAAGLHVCSWPYLKEFKQEDSRILELEIDPKDVVSVPEDYNGTKMRVCRYKPTREVKGERQLKETEAQVKKLAVQLAKKPTPQLSETPRA